MGTSIPGFKLVRDYTDGPFQKVVPDSLQGDINGDQIPDKIEVIDKNDQIGIQIQLGAYRRLTQQPGDREKLGTSLLAGLGPVADLSYSKRQSIWKADIPHGSSVNLLSVEVGDFNQDGDLDIRLTLREKSNENTLIGAYFLMNQSIPDPALAQATPTSPQEEEIPDEIEEHPAPKTNDPKRTG